MKQVTWTDEKGYKHISLLRDEDSEVFAKQGIPCDPPDVESLDWEGVKRDTHNLLVERHMLTLSDIKISTNNLRSVAQDVLFHRLVTLFQSFESGGKNG